LKKIAAVHAISASLVRSIFHELSEIDLPYDERKIDSYVSCGLITSKWVWQQAIIFVKSANEITEPPNLPEDTRDYYKQQEITSGLKGKQGSPAQTFP
jgi:hypothetical protein